MGVTLLMLSGCIPHLYTSDADTGASWSCGENDWGGDGPPDDLVGEGWFEGDVVPDVRGYDQHGDEVCLWQFYGELVILDISTMWCAPCQDLARGVQETAEHFADDGVVYLTLLGEDTEGDPSTPENCEEWAGAFGIESPVLTDPSEVRREIVTDNSYPRVMVIGRDLSVVIEEIETPTDPEIRAAVEDLL